MDYLTEVICLSLDSIIFGLCLKAYLRNKHALKAVENAPEFNVDRNLEKYLKEAGGHITYAAIRGNVKALSPPIRSINQPEISGVVQKLSIKEHVVSRSPSGFWSENQRTINEVINSVPFALISRKSSSEVEVIDVLASEILDLEVISDRFDPSNIGFMDHLWGFFTGVRKRGLQTIEEILKEDALVTAVGEVKDSGGSVKIQPPTDGTPFFVTTMPLNTLVRRIDEKISYCGWFSFGFGLIGVVICGVIVRKVWKKHQELRRIEEEKKRLESTRKERRKHVRNAEDLPKDKICVVCQVNPKEIILLPCGHVCLCEDCNEQINNICPLCNTKIEGRNPAYIA